MSSHNPNLDQPVEPTDTAEARMRLALGLGTRPAHSGQPSPTSGPAPASHDAVRQRRRFAQDGDVPVVMLHRGRDGEAGGENKVAALTADLREERAARLKADRALEEANALISSLRTKLKHSEMALEEKLRGDSEARAHVDALLVAEREARTQAETRAAEATLALSMLERKIEASSKTVPVQPAAAEAVATPPPPDLFGEPDDAAAAPGAPRRRMSRKTNILPKPTTGAAAPMPERSPEQTTKQNAKQVEDTEDKPIEWWLPSFRATRKTPIRRKRAAS